MAIFHQNLAIGELAWVSPAMKQNYLDVVEYLKLSKL